MKQISHRFFKVILCSIFLTCLVYISLHKVNQIFSNVVYLPYQKASKLLSDQFIVTTFPLKENGTEVSKDKCYRYLQDVREKDDEKQGKNESELTNEDISYRKEILKIFKKKKKKCPQSSPPDLPRANLDPAMYNVDCTSPFLSIDGKGRLGNQICEYLSLAILQKLFLFKAALSPALHKTMSTLFKEVNIPLVPPCYNFTQIKQIEFYKIKQLFLKHFASHPKEISGQKLIKTPLVLGSYHCELPLLFQHRHLLQDELELSENSSNLAKNYLNELLQRNNLPLYTKENYTTVGVHIRRGDYESFFKRFHVSRNFSTTCYLNKAFNYFRKRHKNTLFVVAGSDPKWNVENMKPAICEKKDIIFSELATARKNETKDAIMLDMMLLSHCHHHIVTLGTFGWSTSYISPTISTTRLSQHQIGDSGSPISPNISTTVHSQDQRGGTKGVGLSQHQIGGSGSSISPSISTTGLSQDQKGGAKGVGPSQHQIGSTSSSISPNISTTVQSQDQIGGSGPTKGKGKTVLTLAAGKSKNSSYNSPSLSTTGLSQDQIEWTKGQGKTIFTVVAGKSITAIEENFICSKSSDFVGIPDCES